MQRQRCPQDGGNLVANLAINGVIVLAAQPVVPDPSRVRSGNVDTRKPFSAVRGSFITSAPLVGSRSSSVSFATRTVTRRTGAHQTR